MMTDKTNPELAEEYISKSFATLFEIWPVKTDLHANDITHLTHGS